MSRILTLGMIELSGGSTSTNVKSSARMLEQLDQRTVSLA